MSADNDTAAPAARDDASTPDAGRAEDGRAEDGRSASFAPMAAPTRFRAFISYSHRDERWARWLQRQLEAYVAPPEMAGGLTSLGAAGGRLRPIFRDRSDFRVGQGLEAATVDALDASEALIVLCSPDSALSEHVNNEIKLFRTRWPERKVAPLLVRVAKGDVDASFPLALRYEIDGDGELSARPRDVLAADLREEADGRDLALAKIIASLLGVAPDEIFQRQQRRARRRLRSWIAGLSAVAVLTASLAAVAEVSRREALRQRALAEAGELAARSLAMRERNIECSLALASEALRSADRASGAPLRLFEDAVRNTLSRTRVIATLAPAAPRRLSTSQAAWSPSGDLAFVDDQGRAMIWSEATGAAAPLGRINLGPAPSIDVVRGAAADGAPAVAERDAGDGLAAVGSTAPNGAVAGLAWTPDGARLAVIREGALEIWRADARERLSVLPARGVRSFVWSPDGAAALVGVEGAGVFRLETETQATERITALEGPFGRGAAWSPDGARMIVGANGVAALIRDARDGAVSTLTHPAPVVSVAWAPSGGLVAVGLDTGQVWIWDPDTRRRLEILNAHGNQVTDLRFSSDSRRLLTASHDGAMAIWDARSWRRELAMTGHSGPVGAVRWRDDGLRVASTAVDGTVRVWSTGDSRAMRTWAERPGWIWNVEWPGEDGLLAATSDRAILAAPATLGDTGAGVDRIDVADQHLFGGAATEAPLYAYVDDKLLKIRDLSTKSVIFQEEITEEIGRPLTLALAPDGSLVALATLEGVFVWSVRGHERLRSWPTPAVAVAIAPDARRLALFDLTDAAIDLYDIDSGAKLGRLDGPSRDKAIWGLEWSRSGERLAAASDDGGVHVWRVEDGSASHRRFSGHLAEVKDVAWARGDQRLASASLDGAIRIWDAGGGATVASVQAHAGGARSVAWRGDGAQLVSGGEDGAVRLLWADFRTIADLAAEQVAAGLTAAERAACLAAPFAAAPEARASSVDKQDPTRDADADRSAPDRGDLQGGVGATPPLAPTPGGGAPADAPDSQGGDAASAPRN